MKCYSITALALAAAFGTAQANAADPSPGRLLAVQCSQCHGTSMMGKSDLYSKLVEMKSKNKPESIMHQQAKGYTNDEIRLLANYLSNGQ